MTSLQATEPQRAPAPRSRRRDETRNVIAMSIPVVVTMSSRAVMDVTDYMMITGLRVPEAQAAILPAQVLLWSFIVIGMGVVAMVNTFASQSYGRKNWQDCSAYAWQGVHIGVLMGLVGLGLFPLAPVLVGLIGHEPGVQAMELAYLRVALFTVFPTIAAEAFGWFFVGVHRPWVTMWSALESIVVNIAVSYVLIFGLLGFESMGIAGAACGTVVAVCYRMVRLGLTLLGPAVHRQYHSRSTWRPSWRRMRRLWQVGAPCGFQWFFEVVVWAIFVNVLVGSKFGMAHLIATNTAWQYMRLGFLPVVGLGQALTSLVGRSIGAGEPTRAMREVRFAIILTASYMGVLSILYFFKGAELIALWTPDNEEVIRIGAGVMICAAVFQLFDAVAITYGAALRGAGDTFVPSVFIIVSHWIIIIGGGWMVVTIWPGLGSLGPWMAASALIIAAGIFMWWRWNSRAWLKIDIFGRKGADAALAAAEESPTAPDTPGP